MSLLVLNWVHSSHGPDSEENCLIVVDEVNEFASKQLARSSELTEGFFADSMRRALNEKVSMVTIDPNPSLTHEIVRGNARTKICFQLELGDDKLVMGRDYRQPSTRPGPVLQTWRRVRESNPRVVR